MDIFIKISSKVSPATNQISADYLPNITVRSRPTNLIIVGHINYVEISLKLYGIKLSMLIKLQICFVL